MNVAIIGHLVLDEIHTQEGDVHESLGGIAFPLFAFNAVAGPVDRIVPVFPIGSDAENQLEGALRSSDQLSRTHIYHLEAPNTRVRLYHQSLSQYNTRLVASLETIPLQIIEPAVREANLIYINMMTGDDILPATLSAIRKISRAQIFLDVHMIAYATAHDGARRLATVENWRDWTAHVDILQCNEVECKNFIPGFSSEQARIQAIFEQGSTGMVIVTKGESGADVYTRDGSWVHIDAVPPQQLIDPTGCGDVFGSVFAYIYTLLGDAERAGHIAAHAASFVVGIPGSNGIDGLRTYLDSIA